MAWTKEEIKEYTSKRIKDPILRIAYLQARIPTDQPEKRAKYLAEDILKFTMTDHDAIMRVAEKSGKVYALISLEKIFSELY